MLKRSMTHSNRRKGRSPVSWDVNAGSQNLSAGSTFSELFPEDIYMHIRTEWPGTPHEP
jgi:hypothetical protein